MSQSGVGLENYKVATMKKKRNITHAGLGAITMVLVLGGCAGQVTKQTQEDWPVQPVATTAAIGEQAVSAQPAEAVGEVDVEGTIEGLERHIQKGTGVFVSRKAYRQPKVEVVEGDITLNFEKTDVQEVVKVILSELLQQNYLIDPAVQGSISLQTSQPIGRDALLPILENLLRMNGAVLIQEEGLYRVAPLTNATQGSLIASMGRPGQRLGPGYRIQVVPLRYLAAKEMEKILQPFVAEGGILKIDETRNLLMLAGSSQELQSWLTTVAMFDVNWLKGYSVGLYPLEHSEAKTVADEIEIIIGKEVEGKLAGMIRLEPLERLNALLVITPQVRYLDVVQGWIERLDKLGIEPGLKLYVYRVKNRKAADLAVVVSDIFSGKEVRRTEPPVSLAPGLEAVEVKSAETGTETEASTGAGAAPPTQPQVVSAAGLSMPEGSTVRIVADEQNNALMIMATGAEYRIIEAALKKLDVVPLQVLVEASIVEVTLTDDLKYGLEWFFKNTDIVDNKTGRALLDLHAGEGIGPIVPGFSYSLVKGADEVRAVLNMLAEESKLNVLSSPSLMVLDNSQARIQVGEQVPIRTAGQETTAGGILETFEYKDTGVILSVTPRVNVGGLVTMEIEQEVTDIGAIEITTEQRKFLLRTIDSVVAIQSGQTIVLGGLIKEDNSITESGVPVLHKLPIVGKLFGSTEIEKDRTELLVLITPKVVSNQNEAIEITEEFKKRLKRLQPLQERFFEQNAGT